MFPGGWFSRHLPEGRASLDVVAQGEFTPSKVASPTDPIEESATEQSEEEKKGRWCVVM
jgi:hypothetical protein